MYVATCYVYFLIQGHMIFTEHLISFAHPKFQNSNPQLNISLVTYTKHNFIMDRKLTSIM